jgi:hypothetical protein
LPDQALSDERSIERRYITRSVQCRTVSTSSSNSSDHRPSGAADAIRAGIATTDKALRRVEA